MTGVKPFGLLIGTLLQIGTQVLAACANHDKDLSQFAQTLQQNVKDRSPRPIATTLRRYRNFSFRMRRARLKLGKCCSSASGFNLPNTSNDFSPFS